jgi:hypothetical protein
LPWFLRLRAKGGAPMTRTCIVCGKRVADADAAEHLRTNHLGPHHFWFDAVKYKTDEPSLRISELKSIAGAQPMYMTFQETTDGDIALGDDTSVDLTHEPHFYCVPPAASSALRTSGWI